MVGIHSASVELPKTRLSFRNPSMWAWLGGFVRMKTVLECIAMGRLGPAPMVTREVPCERIEHAHRSFAGRQARMVKPLITIG